MLSAGGASERPPLQGVSGMEDTAEGAEGGGAEGDQEVEEPVDSSGAAGRREMWVGSAGLPHPHGCGKAGAASGRRGRRSERGVRVGAPGAPRAGRGKGGGGTGWGGWGRGGAAIIPTDALLHGIGSGRGVGGGSCVSFVISSVTNLLLSSLLSG